MAYNNRVNNSYPVQHPGLSPTGLLITFRLINIGYQNQGQPQQGSFYNQGQPQQGTFYNQSQQFNQNQGYQNQGQPQQGSFYNQSQQFNQNQGQPQQGTFYNQSQQFNQNQGPMYNSQQGFGQVPQTFYQGWCSSYFNQISQQEMGELANWFKTVDRDKSGSISDNELMALQFGNKPIGIDTARKLIAIFDRDKNGNIDFYEYAALHKFLTTMQQAFFSIR